MSSCISNLERSGGQGTSRNLSCPLQRSNFLSKDRETEFGFQLVNRIGHTPPGMCVCVCVCVRVGEWVCVGGCGWV